MTPTPPATQGEKHGRRKRKKLRQLRGGLDVMFVSLPDRPAPTSRQTQDKIAYNKCTDCFKRVTYLDDSSAGLVGGGDDGLAFRRDTVHLTGTRQGILQLQHLLL